MKRIVIKIILLLFIIPFLSGQDNIMIWDYPVKPGTSEWEKLSTFSERINAYNIPEDILSQMSTKSLVETCLNYPELRLILTRNSIQQGYDFIKSKFNGLQELERRKDAGEELLKIYYKLNPQDIHQYETLLEKGSYCFQFFYIELIMAQPSILSNCSPSLKKEILRECINKYEGKLSDGEDYSIFSLMPPVLVSGRILQQEKYAALSNYKSSNTELFNFINYTTNANISDLDLIISIGKSFLDE